jgi:hypothetical protein
MKTNFRIEEKSNTKDQDKKIPEDEMLSQEKFEEFISKSGAKGSFMIYRSLKKEQEMGIDEL